MLDCGLGGGVPAPVREAVWGNVDDAHDARPVERQARQPPPWRAQSLEHVRRIESAAPPIALEEVRQSGKAALEPRPIALDDLDGGEIEPSAGQPQAAQDRFRPVALGRGEQSDRAYVDLAQHR